MIGQILPFVYGRKLLIQISCLGRVCVDSLPFSQRPSVNIFHRVVSRVNVLPTADLFCSSHFSLVLGLSQPFALFVSSV